MTITLQPLVFRIVDFCGGRFVEKIDDKSNAGTQSIERAAQVLRIIASRNSVGLRLVDISKQAKLARPTAHRILKCLMVEGLVRQHSETRRYFLGHLIFELGLAASSSFNLRDICHPSLVRLAEKSGDTVFLAIRSGADSVCIDRVEGAFPIKTFTLDVGTRRPLGVGAGGLALLMKLPDQAQQELVAANALRLSAYNNLTVPVVMKLLKRCRELGFALNDAQVTPGSTSVGLPIRSRSGEPVLAISIGAISSRMTRERLKELAAMIRTEIETLESYIEDTAHP
ncbi:acetate operon repressor [mine drainage metagenome]|uniref:Acetate operon repressor n=1 Tax=mine drainage metagenome TaxID=410659 RepID=A0A1J5RST0_9ZZZZ